MHSKKKQSSGQKGALSPERIAQVLGKGGDFRFRCTACGNCCRHEGSVYFSAQDLENICHYLQKEPKALEGKLIQRRSNGLYVHDSSGPCILLDPKTKRCTVYPVRPFQCRSFPFWPSIFSSKASLEEAKQDCPGMRSQTAPSLQHAELAQKVQENRMRFLAMQDKDSSELML